MPSKIEWTEETWNPITGCSKISEGCQNCYAERMAKRLAGRYGYPKDNPFSWAIHPRQFDRFNHWRKPRRVFVCSMGDLFLYGDGEMERNLEQRKIFTWMKTHPKHTYILLTKRPENMHWWADRWIGWWGEIPENWWLGVTAENQTRADERIPVLLQIPAAVRFVSVEPMLEPVSFRWVTDSLDGLRMLDWVICGGESGPGARGVDLNWVRYLKSQCVNGGVPFFFKQHRNHRGEMVKMPELDGRVWDQMPDQGAL